MVNPRPDSADYVNCAFVITLVDRQRLTYGAGSDLRIDHGELTASDAVGNERRIEVQDWQDVIINASEVLSNRWRRTRPPTTQTSAPPEPPVDDGPEQLS